MISEKPRPMIWLRSRGPEMLPFRIPVQFLKLATNNPKLAHVKLTTPRGDLIKKVAVSNLLENEVEDDSA